MCWIPDENKIVTIAFDVIRSLSFKNWCMQCIVFYHSKQNIYKALHNLMHIIVCTEKNTRLSNHTWHVGKYRVVWLANLSLLSQWCSSSVNFWEFKPVCKKGDIMDVYSDKSINFRHGPLARYVKFQVAHAPGMPGTTSPPTDFKGNRELAIPTCITARASRTCRDACRDG